MLNDRDPLDAVAGLPGAVLVRGDALAVADELAAAALAHHGGLDVVVCNAGSALDAAFHALDDAAWTAVLRDAFEATATVLRACAVPMRDAAAQELARDGRVARRRAITTTVAAAAVTGSPGSANLAAAGGAVRSLTATVARELGPFGITCNAVLVGFVETRMTAPQGPEDRAGTPEPVRQMTRAMTALGRFGTPAEVAAVHAFLVGPDATFVTGAVVPATGGLLGTVG